MNVTLRDVPDELLNRIVNSIKDFAVAIYKDNQQIGSGTLIQFADIKGILTAYHVVHRCSPPLDLSPSSDQTIFLGMTENIHSFKLQAKYLKEIKIGVPINDDVGPDLTFIQIPQSEELSNLNAYKSFWNLDFDREERLDSALNDSGVWVKMGFPNVWEIKREVNEFITHASISGVGFFCFANSDRRYRLNNYDFVDIEAFYDGRDKLPESFGGVSGGGLWKVEIQKSSGGEWSFKKPIFCGLAFYETKKEGVKRIIKCHYARSIYENVYDVLSNTQ